MKAKVKKHAHTN